MSRLALKPIIIPAGVSVTQSDRVVKVTGPKGTLTQAVPAGILVNLEADQIRVKRTKSNPQSYSNHGLIYRLIANMVQGVSVGYTKQLEMVGTGYRAKIQGSGLVISAGYSHPVEFAAPQGIDLKTPTETVITVTGFDKQQVGQVAANIRAIRPPEPYKGKGIRYSGEVIRRKAGKATKVGSA